MKLCYSILLFVGSLCCAALNDGLVAYYPFHGNAEDLSGQGNHGTVYGAVPDADRFGNPNESYWFDGVDDFIQAIDSSSALNLTSSITLSAWVRQDSFIPYFQHIVNKSDVYSGYRLSTWQANPAGSAFELYDDSGQQHITNDGQLPAIGQWVHLAATWDGTTMNIYRNGTLAGSTVFTGTIGVANNDLYIGVGPFYGGQGYFNGLIDEVRVYDRALSADEVQQLYAIPEPATLALLAFGGMLIRRRKPQ